MTVIAGQFGLLCSEAYRKKITRRTTTSERNKSLQVVAVSDKKIQIAKTYSKSQIASHN